VVSSVQIASGTPQIIVNGQSYNLSQITGVTPTPTTSTAPTTTPTNTGSGKNKQQFNSELLEKYMLTALSSAVSGLDAYQEQMDIIGNNIANLNTTGFKSATGNLVDAFSDTLQAATAANGNENATNAIQVGTGVMTGSVTNDWSEGAINATGVTSNMAINGNGFFVVQDPNTGSQYVTQDGTFTLNLNGNLVNSAGMELVGFSNIGLSTPGPIKLTPSGSTPPIRWRP
jgi:flagellar hook protein FlgE